MPQTKAHIREIARRILPELTPVNSRRLETILDLSDDSGNVSLADVLAALYEDKDEAAAQLALRKFRQILSETAASLGIPFSLESDRRTKAPVARRSLRFEVPGVADIVVPEQVGSQIRQAALPTAAALEDQLGRSTEDQTRATAPIIPPTGVPLDTNSPLVRYFVVWAREDSTNSKRALMKWLQPRLRAMAGARVELSADGNIEIRPDGHWRHDAGRSMAACDFGLILVGPALLASKFAVREGLAGMAARKPIFSVELAAVARDGMDLQGLPVQRTCWQEERCRRG